MSTIRLARGRLFTNWERPAWIEKPSMCPSKRTKFWNSSEPRIAWGTSESLRVPAPRLSRKNRVPSGSGSRPSMIS